MSRAALALGKGYPAPRGISPVVVWTLVPIAAALICHPLLPSLAAVVPYLPVQLQPWLRYELPAFPGLQASLGFSLFALLGALWSVPGVGKAFMARGLHGKDMLKGSRAAIVPESIGLPCASLYILLLMLFIPFPFSHLLANSPARLVHEDDKTHGVGQESFPHNELALYLSSLLSLMTATVLGFLDDLFDIRWRHKLPIPLIAAVPTLLVYYAEGGLTEVVLPRGLFGGRIDLGPLYYAYLLLVPTFTTNSINILAGLNGLEVSQAFIIAISVALNDLLYIPIWPNWVIRMVGGHEGTGMILEWALGEVVKRHLMSLYFMLPLIGLCGGFLYHNWYPARAFPGDTFCYFTGMAFSAVAIQGHFSKTLLLFFLPQVFNFILSCPQIFRIVPCPRHRLPRYHEETDLLLPSLAILEEAPSAKTQLLLETLAIFRLTRLEKDESGRIVSCTNLTIPNVVLVVFGPLREQTVVLIICGLQVAGSIVAFAIRYGVGAWVYGGERR